MKGFITGFLLACSIFGISSQAQSGGYSQVGRFVMYQHHDFANQTFLVDSVTGDVRNLVNAKAGGNLWQIDANQGINRK